MLSAHDSTEDTLWAEKRSIFGYVLEGVSYHKGIYIATWVDFEEKNAVYKLGISTHRVHERVEWADFSKQKADSKRKNSTHEHAKESRG